METKKASYNLLDYVRDADQSFDEKAFNEVDGLVMTQVANMNFDNMNIDVNGGRQMTIKELYAEMIATESPSYLLMEYSQKQLLGAMANSERFGDMVLSNYVNNPVTGGDKVVEGFGAVNNRDAFMEQFAAITITYDQNGETYNYMAFQATNDTTDGWTEDFAMLSRECTQAQKNSKDYMNLVVPELEGHVVGGGHSKGGNDFEYGYLFSEESVRSRIEKGYIYDSPGMSDTTLAGTDRYEDFQKIIEGSFVCPQDSIIGQLLHQNRDATYVHSVEQHILEHDPYSWEIDPETQRFVLEEGGQSLLSIKIDEATDAAVANMTREERDAFFYMVQFLMYNNGGESLQGIGDFFTKGWEDPDKKVTEIMGVLAVALLTMTPEERQALLDSLGSFGEAVWPKFQELVEEDFQRWLEETKQAFQDKLRQMWEATGELVDQARKAFRDFLEDVYNLVELVATKKRLGLSGVTTGYWYSKQYTSLAVDTAAMRTLASRISKVNIRIAKLDVRMNSLYKMVNWTDLWDLMSADLMTDFSGRLLLCQNYLNQTAADFEQVESTLSSR